jgi:tRNA uridine 5-carboxymethylaminomethyl modification enzyme
VRRNGAQLLAFPDVTFDQLIALQPSLKAIVPETRQQLAIDALYANYIARQQRDVDSMRRDERHVIPGDFDFESLSGLSNELKAKLGKTRPATLGQAGRVEGMTPAALALILAKLRQADRRRSA